MRLASLAAVAFFVSSVLGIHPCAAQTVRLTAAPTSTTLPDGSTVPMWGYTCNGTSNALLTCSAANAGASGSWSPVVIRATTGSNLTIQLTNKLPPAVPTSIVIPGQLGGGLGTSYINKPSPAHTTQTATWSTANTANTQFTPPEQPDRVQSFAAEAKGGGDETPLTWTNLRAGTYLIESGTHPSIQVPMGLYGVLIVTNAPSTTAGTAYPGVKYNADLPLVLSEIDPVQNAAVQAAVNTPGFSETATHTAIQSGPVVEFTITSGGSGYTSAPTVMLSGGGGTGAAATANIDATGTMTSLSVAAGGSGYNTAPTVTLSGGGGTGATAVANLAQSSAQKQCVDGPGTPAPAACYPSVVNYSPLFYLVNGVSFDKTNLAASAFSTAPAGSASSPVSGTVLLRLVNAGLKMHVPALVGTTTGANSTSGFALIAEDGNPLPGTPRLQNEVFLAAGKTYDVAINAPAASAPAIAMFDRELSLSTNNQRDGGMQGYVSINGAQLPKPAQTQAAANPDSYVVLPGTTLAVSDPTRGVIANDIGVYGVKVKTAPRNGTLTLMPDGTFTYVPNSGWTSSTTDSFVYMANGNKNLTAVVSLAGCSGACLGAAPTAGNFAWTSNVASKFSVGAPGVLAPVTPSGAAGTVDPQGHPLTAVAVTSVSGGTVTLNTDGSFTAIPASAPTGNSTATVSFTFTVKNSQGTPNATNSPGMATVTFLGGSGLKVNVLDAPVGQTGTGTQSAAQALINDYRWIIEEDRTFPTVPGQTTTAGGTVTNLGTNFHTSYMPVVAQGCVGTVACEAGQTLRGQAAVCDVGDGACRTTATQQAAVDPAMVHLDPAKHYYISVLPGDAGNSFSSGAGAVQKNPDGSLRQFSIAKDCGAYTNDPSASNYGSWAPGAGSCGHSMGGAQIGPGASSVNVLVEETPFQPTKVSVFVYEDDFPLNGENDSGGGVDVLAPNEPGLSGFEVRLWDDAGGVGAATGQMTYDMFNQPLTNSLSGTIDPATGLNACALTGAADNIAGRIVTCPKYESDGKTLSPLAGQAIIANLMPGRYGIQANPGRDRTARGEEWIQTNTLDGQKAHDAFIKIGGPSYFQEFGPAGFHVSIGFANPAIINGRRAGVCNGTDINITGSNCTNTVQGTVREMRQSRAPDERLYGSATNKPLSFTQCYVSLGDPDGEDFAFAKCDGNGHFTLTGIPDGDWRITTFDQWNDQIVDGLSTPVRLTNGAGYDFDQHGGLAVQQWHTNVAASLFFDKNGNGVRDPGEDGLALVPFNIRYRDGSFAYFNNTDLNGNATYNEVFPLFNWYVLEADETRYKQTGVHVIYDAGGPANSTDGSLAQDLAATVEKFPLPANLRFPGAVYCGNPDCTDISGGIKAGPLASASNPSSGRIDPAWVHSEGFQGFIGSYELLEFGRTPFIPGENGGIRGEVVYASTRPYDDPTMANHLQWTPDVPNVRVNLYQKSTAADGTSTLKLVDWTTTSSWDDWAQGFRTQADGITPLLDASGNAIPNMNCPGEANSGDQDPFYFTLQNTPTWLDQYNSQLLSGTPHTLPYKSQFKCYDGLHNFNQVQPAPYDGAYRFPSVVSRDPLLGTELKTNCTICVNNPSGDGTHMLPAGKYVVEVIVPPGYELVKEEDKNILIGDNYIAPVTQQFAGFGNIFILPDQAELTSQYNSYNSQDPTTNLGRTTYPTSEVAGTASEFWPCVGQARVVPDYISLFPGSRQVAPFAGATRNLCDRKEVTLSDQSTSTATFSIFSSTHVAAHFSGFILDDLSSEFDPFSPQFGEKFAVPNLPVSIKDFAGNEVDRVYADQWGDYNGLTYSTWEVNPPNPTGYAPGMMVACMNDPGSDTKPDPFFNTSYSKFCYEWSYMPGQTAYMDTPVVPTAAFAEGYNPPDCSYPDATPAVKSVIGSDSNGAVPGSSGFGPWVSGTGTGHNLTITALGPTQVNNPAYSGPQATAPPFNQQYLTRNYNFGAQCTAFGGSCTALSSVTIGGASAKIVSWSPTQIVAEVPANVPACPLLQRTPGKGNSPGKTYPAQCGQLVITSGTGQQSIDAVMVTVGGKPPVFVAGENTTNNAIQSAIDAAAPGDLILVGPGVYNEMLLMWKPIRLQGTGAASTVINANTHPSGKMDAWRREVSCLFGIALNGSLLNAGNAYDPSGTYSCPANMQGAVDPLPLEGIVGWDTTVNGNLAELLQEPTLMGAYEGAGITVLGKGETLSIDSSSTGPNGSSGDFPAGSVPLTSSNADCNNFPSNYFCNPSRIDGLTVTASSQGGGGIFAHAWNQNLEISNNRIFANAGTISGGIAIGQGETPDPTFDANGQELPFLFQSNVNIHNNAVTNNTSYGDELFSATPSAAGGVTICTGSDYYKFNYNWVCGNLNTGEGAGLAHVGFSHQGNISHNWFLFNQSNNITIPTNGGAIAVYGAAPDGLTPTGLECGSTAADADCAPGLSDGTGPGLVIDSNVIMGNTAESGSGGGIRLQSVNGTDITRMPQTPNLWNSVSITNNIIANNVAGWDGGGISMQDAMKVSVVNNTIASNDTTASSGVLFNTLGAPLSNTPPPGCDPVHNPSCTGFAVTTSTPQAAGLVTMQHSAVLLSNMPKNVLCPAGNSQVGSVAAAIFPNLNGNCKSVSYPLLANNLFWQNRTFNIQVGNLGTGVLSQQNLVTLLPQINQTATGQCSNATGYWDIGVRGDLGPADHSSQVTLAPSFSLLTGASFGTFSGTNLIANPNLASQYCNGSHVPPEMGGTSNPFGYQVPPGISDATIPNPVFNLTPAATVDEGNNWINLTYGPLSIANPTLAPMPSITTQPGTANANYVLTAGSPAIGVITSATAPINYSLAPALDLLGNNRKASGKVDIGAVQYTPPPYPIVSIAPTSLNFGTQADNLTSPAQFLTLTNTGGAPFTVPAPTFSSPVFAVGSGAGAGTCGATLAAGASCTVGIVFTPVNPIAYTGTASWSGTVSVAGSPVQLSGTGKLPALTASLAPSSLTFASTVDTQTSAAQTVTVTNTGGAALSGGTFTFAGQFARSTTSPGTCSAALAANASCTINVVFVPTGTGTLSGSLTVTYTGATVTPTLVTLGGTGIAVITTAKLAPATWTPTQTRNCPGLFCGLDPTQAFTLTNTGNVPLTSITQGVLGGANTADYGLVLLTSTCGPATGGQILSVTNLNPGASCQVVVQFRPRTADPKGSQRPATITLTDSFGTQSATLNGTAN